MAKKIVQPVEVQASVAGDQSVKSFKAQLREAKEEALRLAAAFGETDQRTLAAARRVAELKDRMDDVNATIAGLHPDRFQQIANITSTMANGFAAAQGAAALLGSESEDLQKQMVKVQGAMAFAQGIAGLKDLKFQLGDIPKTIYSKVVPAFTTAAGAARAIGTALGIGVIIAGVTALVAVFKNLDLSIDGVAKKDKDLLKSQEARLQASKDNVDALDAQDNILKLQGKSERDILKLKIAALQTAIDNQKAVIATSKAQATAQIAAAKRNKDILMGILNFITAPTKLILDTIDSIAKKLGYETGLAKTFEGLKESAANLVFDPEETKKEAEENQKEMEKELVSMENTVAGHKLAIKAIDKQAADERRKAAQEAAAKAKSDEEQRLKDAEDAQKKQLQIDADAQKAREETAKAAEERSKRAIESEMAGIKRFYDEQELAAIRAATSKEDLEKRMAQITKDRLANELQALTDAGASTVEVEKQIAQLRLNEQIAASEEAKAVAKAEADFKKTLEQDIIASLNAIADIAGQNSKTAKAIALAQIAYDTGKALMSALENSQSTKSVDNQLTGGLSGLAKFAAISAVILTNSARAIRIVKSGNPAGGNNAPAPSPGRGVPQLQSAASSLGGGTQFAGQFDNRVYVTEGDITNTQRRVRQNRGVSVI